MLQDTRTITIQSWRHCKMHVRWSLNCSDVARLQHIHREIIVKVPQDVGSTRAHFTAPWWPLKSCRHRTNCSSDECLKLSRLKKNNLVMCPRRTCFNSLAPPPQLTSTLETPSEKTFLRLEYGCVCDVMLTELHHATTLGTCLERLGLGDGLETCLVLLYQSYLFCNQTSYGSRI